MGTSTSQMEISTVALCLVRFEWHLAHESTVIVNICTSAYRLWYSEKMKLKAVWLMRLREETPTFHSTSAFHECHV